MRNWNLITVTVPTPLLAGVYRTYEELKPAHEQGTGIAKISGLSYLWGIETRVKQTPAYTRPWVYRTYEELKPWVVGETQGWKIRVYRTYEELKPILILQSGVLPNGGFIVPMRNWNICL